MNIRTKWIFPDERGERGDPNRAYKQWRFFCRTHDVQSSIHEMRHSHISLLIDMGFSAVAIAERMGHESIAIT